MGPDLTRFYQMIPIAKRHDAVGRMAWALHSLLESWGKRSLIFTERQRSFRIGPWAAGPLRRGLLGGTPWPGEPAPDFLFYQHSIGTTVADRFLEWPAKRKILLYQNITPDDLEGISPAAREAQRWGRRQLDALIHGSDLQVGFSRYTCDELRERGATGVLQLPYLMWRRDIAPGPEERPGPRILVVGRVVPHKGIREAVQTLAELRRQFPAATLTVLGNLRGDPPYVQKVRDTIASLGLDRAVSLVGRVSDRALCAHYRNASVLLSLSEHEGFCVPLVEAMRARTPVVALANTAVPETLGTGGLLIEGRDPAEAARAIGQILGDQGLRGRLREAQAREADRFTVESFATPLQQALSRL